MKETDTKEKSYEGFVDLDKVEFEKLKQPQLKLLLKALEIDKNNLVCRYCKDKVSLDKVSVLPSFNNEIAIITCDSPLCILEYMQDCEESKEKHIKKSKEDKIRQETTDQMCFSLQAKKPTLKKLVLAKYLKELAKGDINDIIEPNELLFNLTFKEIIKQIKEVKENGRN